MMSLHAIAEALHKFVWEVEEMSTSEYLSWIQFFEQRAEDQKQAEEVKKGNLMAMNPDQIVGAVTGGK